MKVNFYLYFNNEEDGKKLIHILEKEGFKLEHYNTLEYDNKVKWSLLVTKDIQSEEELDKFDNPDGFLEMKASEFNGEYDGYDRPVAT